jgi:ABC-type multidrug transport system, ATPase component
MIKAQNLIKDYGELRAVDDVSFTITSGEIVGLLGLNGAGKTTLLRMLASLLTPTSGVVTVDGAELEADGEAVRQRIGFLPEIPPLYGEMTVANFLGFVARLRKVPYDEAEGRVREVAERCQIGEVLHQHIDTLSFGYRKRVGIAQAIIHQPPLVILDEPIAGLDPAQIVEMRELVKQLRGAHTVVLSSHILAEISQTCDRILVMHHGRIVAQGSESELGSQISKDQCINLQVRAAREVVSEMIRDYPGVLNLTVTHEGRGVVHLTVVSNRDIKEELSATIIKAGLGLRHLSSSEERLEEIFLSLTSTT